MQKTLASALAPFLLLLLAGQEASAVCDGNPHGWNRTRRCDAYDATCPDVYKDCSVCEGIGGIAYGDKPEEFKPAKCSPVATAAEMEKKNIKPIAPIFPENFVNTGFHEVQIFVKRDPFCLAQIPAMVSNGTHCYKNQHGTFNYDVSQIALRIDYLQSRTVIPANMTETFYHIDSCVHPHISRIGKVPTSIICPCINLTIGPVAPRFALGGSFVGREKLEIEFLRGLPSAIREVDHWIIGPHHAWADVETGNLIRLWQPFNGLEIFDPREWEVNAVKESLRVLPEACKLESKACIQA